MQKIRQLASNIFVKILMAFLVLSFALFGISNFLLNGSGTWVAKVDGKSISYSHLLKAMQSDREAILRANPNNPKATQYLESSQFKSDVLGRLVNHILIDKLRNNFGVEASKTIILEAVAKDPQFVKDGKFDHAIFKQFLAQNGFDEDKYVKAVQDEIVGTMIISSISAASPIDNKLVVQIADSKSEKRFADVIILTNKNIGQVAPAQEKELVEFYNKNKKRFAKAETRKVSYLAIYKQELGKLSEDEMQKKLGAIENELAGAKSLDEVVQKFALKTKVLTEEIDQSGKNSVGIPVNTVKAFDNFTQNAFALKEGQISKLTHSKSNDTLYAIKVEKIDAAREKTFEEVKFIIVDLYAKEQRLAALKELARKIDGEVKQDPSKAAQIAAKNGFKFERNKEFPRFYFLNFQGQNIPYATKFNEDLFNIKINQATAANAVSNEEFKIGILRSIKKVPTSATQIEADKMTLIKEYRGEFLQEFNKFLQKKFPIKVNEKFLSEMEKKEEK